MRQVDTRCGAAALPADMAPAAPASVVCGFWAGAGSAPMRRLPLPLLLLLTLLLTAAGGAHAIRSPECPGGCIVAVTQHPRTCACVQERCGGGGGGAPGSAQAMAALSAAARSGASGATDALRDLQKRGAGAAAGTASDPSQQDCGFCDASFNTYASMAACEDAGNTLARTTAAAAVPPGGAQLARSAATRYPSLADSASPAAKAQLAAMAAAANNGGSDADLAAAVAAASKDLALAPTPATVCSWPITPPSGDGVSRTACPYDATNDGTLQRWEVLYPSTTLATDVTLPANAKVVISGCALSGALSVGTITIPSGSALIIADEPLALAVKRITVNGVLSIGAASCPIKSGITVSVPNGDVTNGVDMASGGRVDIHGTVIGPTWTRVSATVPASTGGTPSRVVRVADAVSWAPGTKIVLVSTYWRDTAVDQNEVLTVQSVTDSGRTITVAENIVFQHYGGEYQAEVGLLTRNILFTSPADANGIGPHTTLFGPDARIRGAAYERWGARNQPGKYSTHFHLVGDAPNALIENNSYFNSNWRCISLHATNRVTLRGNVGFNIVGHCYYLEDGVEELNVLERNLAAKITPINEAGSGGGQQGTDRWASATLFDPSDSGAAGFYALNAHNTWLGNAASGGFAGFTFPNAPRAIKDSRNARDAAGFPLKPSSRPFVLFKDNTAHSSGHQWEHGACIYAGGFLVYRTDSGGTERLFYNNGRGKVQLPQLCPDPNWPAGQDGASDDCWVGSERSTRNEAGTGDGYLRFESSTVALCNVGINSWGVRAEVAGLQAYDITKGAAFLGQSWVDNAHFEINTANAVSGRAGWPFDGYNGGPPSSNVAWWSAPPIKGFEWYDTFTTTIMTGSTFKNYKYFDYPSTDDWWVRNTPAAVRMLSHSDVFKPDKTMMATKGITVVGADLGSCSASGCTGNSLFRVDRTVNGASMQFNWLDADGSFIRAANASTPAGRYLIGSFLPWWNLYPGCWIEPNLSGIWVCPFDDPSVVVARLDIAVTNADGSQRFTHAYEESNSDPTPIGWTSLFSSVARRLPTTMTEGTTGVTGNLGWYQVYEPNGAGQGYFAPRGLRIITTNFRRERWVYWTSCWPAGTTFTVRREFKWSACQNVAALRKVTTREALVGSADGSDYYVDGNNCLHLKVMDPGAPWEYEASFERAGLRIEEITGWMDRSYVVVPKFAATGPCNQFWCPLSGDPAARRPGPIGSPPLPTCTDVQPPPGGPTCAAIECGWANGVTCSSAAVTSGGWCKRTCGVCSGSPVASLPPMDTDAGSGGGGGGSGGGGGGGSGGTGTDGTTSGVLTFFDVRTSTAKCPKWATRTAIKSAAASGARAVAACTAKGDQTAGKKVVVDVVAVAAQAALRAPPLRTIACPSGYGRLKKSVTERAKPVNGKATTIALCVLYSDTGAPITDLKSASAEADCVAADGWRAALFSEASALNAGGAADLALGTGAAPAYLCLKQAA